MKFVEPHVFLIAETKLNYDETIEWLKHLGSDPDWVLGKDEFYEEAEKIVELCSRRCYLSFRTPNGEFLNENISRVREDIEAHISNILNSGHGSVLEHVNFTFAIEGVSRVFTAEMNRHRAGVAVSEGSLRFIRSSNIAFVKTPQMEKWAEEEPGEFEVLFYESEQEYQALEKRAEEVFGSGKFSEKKKLTSLLRRILPMGVATGGVWTTNIRALRHIVTMRTNIAAEEEIQIVAAKMLEKAMERAPLLFGDFEKNEDGEWEPLNRKV